jgi:hypothetical protein
MTLIILFVSTPSAEDPYEFEIELCDTTPAAGGVEIGDKAATTPAPLTLPSRLVFV